MNKIIMNIGLLLFFLAVIFFSQRELPVQDVLLRSFAIFICGTAMLAILGIIFIRSINKTALNKSTKASENLSGNN
jgi:hypothetical protein